MSEFGVGLGKSADFPSLFINSDGNDNGQLALAL